MSDGMTDAAAVVDCDYPISCIWRCSPLYSLHARDTSKLRSLRHDMIWPYEVINATVATIYSSMDDAFASPNLREENENRSTVCRSYGL